MDPQSFSQNSKIQSPQTEDVQIRNSAHIPITVNGQTHSSYFISFSGLSSNKEHIAIVFPGWEHNPKPMIRIHSECLTGDAFQSQKCDCGLQLNEALEKLSANAGILLYMRDEGRGIGLYNKIDAYVLQEQGMDTYEANHALNFREDERDYQEAARMLKALGKTTVKLLTNNPDKIAQLTSFGINVDSQIPTKTHVNKNNVNYLKAKLIRTQHTLNPEQLKEEVP